MDNQNLLKYSKRDVMTALEKVKANKGGAGVDGEF